jgi:prepilin-type processing-associated H-X9-DG protein
MAHSQNNGAAMNRPSIFPCGGDGYLSRYLGSERRHPTTGFMYNSIPSAKLYTCPEIEPLVDQSLQWSVYSYRYNSVLGGQDAVQWGVGLGSSHLYTPWKLSRVRQSSNVALFTEGNSPTGALDPRLMGLVTEANPNRPSNKYGHNPRYGFWLHSPKNTGAYYSYWNNSWNNVGRSGTINIGYCDGSVRSVQWTLNAYPAPPFPDTFIDPYHIGESSW